MNDEQRHFLSVLRRPPLRLTAEQAAWALNCAPHDIPVLIGARLLKPLGTPASNGTKFFATADVLKLAEDRSWLARVTNAVQNHWRGKNALKLHRAGHRAVTPRNGVPRSIRES